MTRSIASTRHTLIALFWSRVSWFHICEYTFLSGPMPKGPHAFPGDSTRTLFIANRRRCTGPWDPMSIDTLRFMALSYEDMTSSPTWSIRRAFMQPHGKLPGERTVNKQEQKKLRKNVFHHFSALANLQKFYSSVCSRFSSYSTFFGSTIPDHNDTAF